MAALINVASSSSRPVQQQTSQTPHPAAAAAAPSAAMSAVTEMLKRKLQQRLLAESAKKRKLAQDDDDAGRQTDFVVDVWDKNALRPPTTTTLHGPPPSALPSLPVLPQNPQALSTAVRFRAPAPSTAAFQATAHVAATTKRPKKKSKKKPAAAAPVVVSPTEVGAPETVTNGGNVNKMASPLPDPAVAAVGVPPSSCPMARLPAELSARTCHVTCANADVRQHNATNGIVNLDPSLWPIVYGDNPRQMDDYIHHIYCRECQKTQEQICQLATGDERNGDGEDDDIHRTFAECAENPGSVTMAVIDRRTSQSDDATQHCHNLSPESISCDVTSEHPHMWPMSSAAAVAQPQPGAEMTSAPCGGATSPTDHRSAAAAKSRKSCGQSKPTASAVVQPTTTPVVAVPKTPSKIIKFHEYKGPPGASTKAPPPPSQQQQQQDHNESMATAVGDGSVCVVPPIQILLQPATVELVRKRQQLAAQTSHGDSRNTGGVAGGPTPVEVVGGGAVAARGTVVVSFCNASSSAAVGSSSPPAVGLKTPGVVATGEAKNGGGESVVFSVVSSPLVQKTACPVVHSVNGHVTPPTSGTIDGSSVQAAMTSHPLRSPQPPPQPASSSSARYACRPPCVQSSPSPSTGSPSKTGRSGEPPCKTAPPAHLEDVRVADLKAECRVRSLAVSGPKPNLIARLRPYADEILRRLATSSSGAGNIEQSTAGNGVVMATGNAQRLQVPANTLHPPPVVTTIINPVNVLGHLQSPPPGMTSPSSVADAGRCKGSPDLRPPGGPPFQPSSTPTTTSPVATCGTPLGLPSLGSHGSTSGIPAPATHAAPVIFHPLLQCSSNSGGGSPTDWSTRAFIPTVLSVFTPSSPSNGGISLSTLVRQTFQRRHDDAQQPQPQFQHQQHQQQPGIVFDSGSGDLSPSSRLVHLRAASMLHQHQQQPTPRGTATNVVSHQPLSRLVGLPPPPSTHGTLGGAAAASAKTTTSPAGVEAAAPTAALTILSPEELLDRQRRMITHLKEMLDESRQQLLESQKLKNQRDAVSCERQLYFNPIDRVPPTTPIRQPDVSNNLSCHSPSRVVPSVAAADEQLKFVSMETEIEPPSSPFCLSIPLKEPPKYDDVIRNKQNSAGNLFSSTSPVEPHHTNVVSDILDFLTSHPDCPLSDGDVRTSPSSSIPSDYETYLSDSANVSTAAPSSAAPSTDDVDDMLTEHLSSTSSSAASSSGISSASSVFPDIGAQPFLMLDDWADGGAFADATDDLLRMNGIKQEMLTVHDGSRNDGRGAGGGIGAGGVRQDSNRSGGQPAYGCTDACLGAAAVSGADADFPDGLDFSDLLDMILPADGSLMMDTGDGGGCCGGAPMSSTHGRNILDDLFDDDGDNDDAMQLGNCTSGLSSSIEYAVEAVHMKS